MEKNSRMTLKPKEGGPTFSFSHRMFRFFWRITWALLASWTPPGFWRWRRCILICFGAKLAPVCDVRGSADVWYPPNLTMKTRSLIAEGVICYNVEHINIGNSAIISQRAHLCTASHELKTSDFMLVARPIEIACHSWIGAEAFVGPGVLVGTGAVLGARGVAFTNLEPWQVYRGNPATPLKFRHNLQEI